MPAPYLKRDKSTGVYSVHWTEPGGRGKRVSTRQKDLAPAKAFFAEWLLIEQRAPGDDTGEPIEVYYKLYLAKHDFRSLRSREYARQCWGNLSKHFALLTPTALDQDAFDGYVAARAAGRIGRPSKPQTAKREIRSLLAALAHSDKQPPKRPRLPVDGPARERWLRPAEVAAIHAAAEALHPRATKLTRIRLYIWLALETAARLEAIMQLTWDRVDFETDVIHFDWAERRKTKKRRASVPISRNLRPVLLRAHDERDGERVVAGNKDTVWAAVQRVVRRAGLAPPSVKRSSSRATGISPHTFRHTAATSMARRGVPLWIIAKILGNTVAMVERVYAKHSPEDLRDAVNLISAPHTGQVESKHGSSPEAGSAGELKYSTV